MTNSYANEDDIILFDRGVGIGIGIDLIEMLWNVEECGIVIVIVTFGKKGGNYMRFPAKYHFHACKKRAHRPHRLESPISRQIFAT